MRATCIWQPKFSTQEVLVATTKIIDGKNYLFFAGDRNHPDLYSFNGEKVKSECKISSNGKILCYNIPLSWLNNEGDLPEECARVRDAEYLRFKNKMKKK